MTDVGELRQQRANGVDRRLGLSVHFQIEGVANGHLIESRAGQCFWNEANAQHATLSVELGDGEADAVQRDETLGHQIRHPRGGYGRGQAAIGFHRHYRAGRGHMPGQHVATHFFAKPKRAFHVHGIAHPQAGEIGRSQRLRDQIEADPVYALARVDGRGRKASAVDGDRRAGNKPLRVVAEIDANSGALAVSRQRSDNTNALNNSAENRRAPSADRAG